MTTRTQATDRAPAYRWVVMGLWLFGGVTGFMMISTLGVLLPSISHEFSLSPSQQGLLGSAAFWGNLFLAIPLSWWTSRYGPKALSTVTMVLCTLSLLLQGWAPAFAVLLAGRLAFGVAILAREPARALLVQQWFLQREVIIVNGVSNVLFGLVVGGGLVATPWILNNLGGDWRGAMYLFAVLFAALTVLWMALGRERVTEAYRRLGVPREVGLLRGAMSYRDLWVGGFGVLGTNLAWSGFLSFYPTLMLDTYSVPLQWSGAVLALGIFTGGVSGLGIGYVVLHWDQRKVILQVMGVLMAGTYVGMTLTGSIPLLAVLSFFNGIAWGFWPILYTVPFQLPGIRPREVAVALAFTMTAVSAGTVLGPMLAGFLQEILGDLRVSLLLASFGALSLTVTGLLLRLAPQAEVATQQVGETEARAPKPSE